MPGEIVNKENVLGNKELSRNAKLGTTDKD